MSEIVYQDDLSKVILVDDVEDIKQYTDVELVDKVIGFYESWKDDGDLYLIHKNRQHQYYIHQESISSMDYFDEEFNKVSVVDFKTNLRDAGLTGALKYINENIGSDKTDIYDAVLNLSKNISINKHYLKLYNDNISDVRISEKNPSRSIFVLKFDDDEYFTALNLSEEERWFLNSVYSYYGYEWSESADIGYEWKGGYVLGSFNNENLQKIVTVLTNNGEYELSNSISDKGSEISGMLEDLYPEEVEDIKREYGYSMDNESNKVAKEDIVKYYCNPLFKYGFIEADCMSKYFVTCKTLKKIYDEVGIPELPLPELLKTFFENQGVNFDENLSEYRYEYQQINVEEFNRNISSILDKMIEESENEMDEDSEKIKGLIKKYGLRRENQTPKGAFMIMGYDLNDGTIDYIFNKGENYTVYSSEKRRATYEDFMNFLNNYELFEQRTSMNQVNMVDKFMDSLKPMNNPQPISRLITLLNKFNSSNIGQPKLNLKSILNNPGNSKFKINLIGLPSFPDGSQKVISIADITLNDNITFTIEKNPFSGKTLPGVKIKF